MTSLAYIPIAGTGAWSRDGEWERAGSFFDRHLQRQGWTRRANEFGFWSTALTGTFFTASGHATWQFGAYVLRNFLLTLPVEDRILLAHSHGGQVAAYALALEPLLPIRALVTIDVPCRRDMHEVWETGSFAVPLHIHLYGTGLGSAVRWLGQRGHFARRISTATENLPIKGGHSGILRKAKYVTQIDPILQRIRDQG